MPCLLDPERKIGPDAGDSSEPLPFYLPSGDRKGTFPNQK